MSNTCVSTWQNEKLPGSGWQYDEVGMTYDADLFDTLEPLYDSLGTVTEWTEDVEIADVEAIYLYEHVNGQGWQYDEIGMVYDSTLLDGYVPYYDTLGLATAWDAEVDVADVAVDWNYEHRNAEGWLYDEPVMLYDDLYFDGLKVYYNRLGIATEWSYEDAIDGCAAVLFYFMSGASYTFQDGRLKEFQ